MNTKLIMTATAILLAGIGICLSFAADEIMVSLSISTTLIARLTLQLLGAMYYAFAILNWMVKGAIIGGIYNRPIAVANFTHFFIGGIVLTKEVLTNHQSTAIISILAGTYMLMTGVFGFMISRQPRKTAA